MKPKRLLAILLSLVMTMSLFPATAFAAGDTGQGETMRVFHLDCGRKYFSEQQIKNLIDEMAQDGYNYLELAVGNDGLRFLLDDMSLKYSIGASAVEAEEEEPAVRLMEEEAPAEEMPAAAPEARAAGSSEHSFTSDAVKNAIKAGNNAYTMASSGELTQTEMDRIISYAEEKDISIIPLVNTPGHMDAILSAAQSLTEVRGLAYSSSKTTIDVTNPEAVAFTQALLQKYITYFADQGCTYFNMGADEYANDIFISGGMGFGNLASSGKYGDFINYINAVAGMIKTARMTPIAFNDGIRYNGQEPVKISRDIIVSYWSSGWGGYNVAPAADLANAGFQILNTSGDWYYVLKTGAPDINYVKKQISKTPWTSVMGSTVKQSDLVGAMVCLWCDDPGFTYSEGNAKAQIKVFAESNRDLFTVKPVVKDLPFMVETADGTESEPLTQAGLAITRGKAQTLTYTGEGTIKANAADDTDVFSVDVSGNSITVVARNRGTGTLHIAVTAEAPMTRAYAATTGTEYDIPITVAAETDSLEAEFWCTNTRVTGVDVNANKTAISFAEDNKPVNIANSVPKVGTSSGRTYVYWKSVILPEGQYQTSTDGVDQTHSGTEIIAVMYDGTDYFYYSKADPKTAVKIKPTDQLVSYYKQVFVKLKNNHAVITGADWGAEQYYNWAPNSVQYTITEMDENRTQIGSQSSTMWYGPDGQIKDIGAPVAAGYEVYTVTVTQGTSTTTYGEGGRESVPENLTLNRGSNYEVTYYIRPVTNLKVTYEWLGAPARARLPVDENSYAKNAEVAVDTVYTNGMTLPVGTDEYTFHGWYANAKYEGAPVNSFTITVPTTLYGYWTKTDAKRLEIKAASGTKVYDGTALTAPTYTVSYDGEKLIKGTDGWYTANRIQFKLSDDVEVTGSQTDAGVSDNKISGTIVYKETGATAATFKNVAWVNGSLRVTKRAVTLKSADLSKPYDGTALVNGGTALAKEDGWVTGEGATYAFTGSQTKVGSSANAFSYTLNSNTKAGNYVITKTEGILTVTNRDAKYGITVEANGGSYKYDGTEKSVSGLKETTFTVEGSKYTVSGLTAEAKGTDAGSYPVNVTGTATVKDAAGNDVTAQFSVKTVNGTLTVTKRDVTITSGSATKQYDGKALTNHEVEVTGDGFVDGQGADYSYTGSQTLVGSSENSFSYTLKEGTKADNYVITKTEGTLTVTDNGGSSGGGSTSTPGDNDGPGLNKQDHIAYVSGYPDGTVQPNGYITREEVATMFFRLLTDASRANYITNYNPFPDVARERWSFYSITTMNNADIMTGRTNGMFDPGANITRAEFAVVAAQFSKAQYTGPDKFSDISDHWARDYINRAAAEGWIAGYPDGTFGPERYITRAEVMALVNEVLDRAPDADYMLEDMIRWPDNPELTWYYEDVQEATNSHSYVWRNANHTVEEWKKWIPMRTYDQMVRDAFNGVGIDR